MSLCWNYILSFLTSHILLIFPLIGNRLSCGRQRSTLARALVSGRVNLDLGPHLLFLCCVILGELLNLSDLFLSTCKTEIKAFSLKEDGVRISVKALHKP